MSRKEPVVLFGERPTPEQRRILDTLERVLGKISALVDVCLLNIVAGHTVTNAATDPGTALTVTRTEIDFLDAGIDSVRLVVRGQNSAAGSVTVQAYNTTQSRAMATATITDATEQTADSGWQTFTPAGGDEAVELRVVGDGAFDPVLFNVHLQGRSVKVQP